MRVVLVQMVNKYCEYCGKVMRKVHGRRKYHKECLVFFKKEYNKRYNLKNKEKNKRNYLEYINIPGKREQKNKRMMEYHKLPGILERKREYEKKRQKRPEIKEKTKKYREKEPYKSWRKKYIKEYNKKYNKENPDYNNKYNKKRRKTDKNFRIVCYLRIRLWYALKHYTKIGKIMSSKKYGIDYKAIIEKLKPFPKNILSYEIDHKRPLCSFNFVNPDGSTNLEEVRKAFAPENHQWLTIKENRSKGRKY